MYCSNCGKENSANSKFCKNCGKKLSDISNLRVDILEEKNRTQKGRGGGNFFVELLPYVWEQLLF